MSHTYSAAHFGNNEFSIFWAIQLQLLGYVGQGDARIRKADHANPCVRKTTNQTINGVDTHQDIH